MKIYVILSFTLLFLYLSTMKDSSLSSFIFLFFLLVLFVFISIIKVSMRIKGLFILFLLILFYRTIILTITIISLAIQKYNKMLTFTELRNNVKNLLSNNLKLDENFSSIKELPTIYVANYPTNKIEIAASLLLPGKICFMMAEKFAKRTQLIRILSNYIIRSESHNQYEIIKKKIVKKLEKNNCIFAYVSKQSYFPNYITHLRRGLFAIAKELKISITPIYISEIKSFCGIVTSKKLKIIASRQIKVQDINKAINETRNFFLGCKKQENEL